MGNEVQQLLVANGLKVVDLSWGMAPALVAKFLRESGADIVRVGAKADDPFFDIYPAYKVWQAGTAWDAAAARDPDRLQSLLQDADICLIGGEDHPEAARVAPEAVAGHPRLVVLNIEGYPEFSADAGRPAADVLVQARAGLTNEHYAGRPNLMAFHPATYGAVLQGLMGLFAALYEREASGRGQVVSTSLFEGALAWTLSLSGIAERPTHSFNFAVPKDPMPLIVQCADGVWVHLVLGSTGSKTRLYKILQIDDPTVGPNDDGLPSASDPPSKFFGDVETISASVRLRQSEELLKEAWEAGLVAAKALPPGACWDDPQVQSNQIVARSEDGILHVGHPIIARVSPAEAARPSQTAELPLAGVRAVDFGAFVAGPAASTVLGDLGADVVKVEPTQGDPVRGVFRSHSSVNRGKRTMALDMRTPQGLEIAQRLSANADIVTSNFRPGVSARMGIDPKTLHGLHSDLIVLEISGYGAEGPNAGRAAFDPVMQAFCGHEVRAGGLGNPPLWNRTVMIDYATGFIGGIALTMGLYHRARTGDGASFHTSLVSGGAYLLSDVLRAADRPHEEPMVLNATQTGFHPLECLYEASDGWIAICVRGNAALGGLLRVLKLDGQLSRNPSEWSEADVEALSKAIRRHPRDPLLEDLKGAGVWAEPCLESEQINALRDEAFVKAGTVHSAEHPDFGMVSVYGPLFRFSRSRRSGNGYAPLFGEHTREILAELGYDDSEIEQLFINRVVA